MAAIGAAMFMLAMVANLQYAMNGYGIGKYSLNSQVVAQANADVTYPYTGPETGTGSGTGTGTGTGTGSDNGAIWIPEVTITCSFPNHSGYCNYFDWSLCQDGYFLNYKCTWSGYQADYCSGLLETICKKLTF